MIVHCFLDFFSQPALLKRQYHARSFARTISRKKINKQLFGVYDMEERQVSWSFDLILRVVFFRSGDWKIFYPRRKTTRSSYEQKLV